MNYFVQTNGYTLHVVLPLFCVFVKCVFIKLTHYSVAKDKKHN